MNTFLTTNSDTPYIVRKQPALIRSMNDMVIARFIEANIWHDFDIELPYELDGCSPQAKASYKHLMNNFYFEADREDMIMFFKRNSELTVRDSDKAIVKMWDGAFRGRMIGEAYKNDWYERHQPQQTNIDYYEGGENQKDA
jgi:hypothetical protein